MYVYNEGRTPSPSRSLRRLSNKPGEMGEAAHAQRRMPPIASPMTITRLVSSPAALRQHAGGLGAANAYANRTVVKLQAPNGVAPSELQSGKVRVCVGGGGLLHLLRPSPPA